MTPSRRTTGPRQATSPTSLVVRAFTDMAGILELAVSPARGVGMKIALAGRGASAGSAVGRQGIVMHRQGDRRNEARRRIGEAQSAAVQLCDRQDQCKTQACAGGVARNL